MLPRLTQNNPRNRCLEHIEFASERRLIMGASGPQATDFKDILCYQFVVPLRFAKGHDSLTIQCAVGVEVVIGTRNPLQILGTVIRGITVLVIDLMPFRGGAVERHRHKPMNVGVSNGITAKNDLLILPVRASALGNQNVSDSRSTTRRQSSYTSKIGNLITGVAQYRAPLFHIFHDTTMRWITFAALKAEIADLRKALPAA